MSAPTYAVPAPGGGILISDYANNRIRKVSKSGVIRTIVGTGVGGFNGDGHRPTHTELDNPTSAVPLPGGGLLISDFVNNRIRKVTSR